MFCRNIRKLPFTNNNKHTHHQESAKAVTKKNVAEGPKMTTGTEAVSTAV